MTATAAEIIAAARSLIGVPYHHQGRDPAVALDCVGLGIVVAGMVGIPALDESGYGRTGNGDLLVRCLAEQYPQIEPSDAQPGDLIACRIRPGGRATHMGILGERAGELTLIHTYARVMRVVEHGFVSPWTERTVAAFRWGEA